MKKIFILLVFISSFSYSQETSIPLNKSNKGRFYLYWGWNRSVYTKSDITFKGDNYDFTLDNVSAKDRQTPFSWKKYFGFKTISIPQYNFRFGYFFNEKWQISYGIDHMKYVMVQDQNVIINGEINNSGTVYDGVYNNQEIQLKKNFLIFEHTDGLNYINLEVRRFDKLFEYKKIKLNHTEGIGAGMLLPKTNATLLNNSRHDDFHISGLGINALVGLNLEIYRLFFIQGELKVGYINMPSIRTTINPSDLAKQQFSYLQYNIVFGVNINSKKK